MTAATFSSIWAANFTASPPISYLLRQLYPTRWFRIHSLPESKRYPETAAEWAILLERQLTIFADLLGDPADVLLVTGYYTEADTREMPQFLQENTVFTHIHFTPLSGVNMRDFPDPREPDNSLTYWPLVAELVLTDSWLEQLLRAIAQAESQAFFFNQRHGTVIAPYDGGVDVILAEELTRNFLKHKYHAWLSSRKDGL